MDTTGWLEHWPPRPETELVIMCGSMHALLSHAAELNLSVRDYTPPIVPWLPDVPRSSTAGTLARNRNGPVAGALPAPPRPLNDERLDPVPAGQLDHMRG
jgi:hypothetical protein